MARRSKVRVVQKTLLIVGEGKQDSAFLNHLKQLYDGRHSGQKVTVKPAAGRSPNDIVDCAISASHAANFDKKIALLDEDIDIPQSVSSMAKKHNVEMVVSKPLCLEGMLLEMIGQPVPSTSAGCKKSLHPQLSGNPVDRRSYEHLFTQSVVDASSNSTIQRLVAVISNS